MIERKQKYSSIRGYDFIKDELTGNMIAISKETGEVTNAINCLLPARSIIYTPEQQDQYKKRKERERYGKECDKELGHFFFTNRRDIFSDISAESTARLIYLNTFVRHNENILMITERKPMKRCDLQGVLNLSPSTISRFWNEVSPKYITETGEGLILTNHSFFIRGSLEEKKGSFLKTYIEGVRKLYKSTSIRNHRQLGHIFRLLPMINIEYNVLCHNPEEKDLDKVDFISLAEFCSMANISTAHTERLLKTYNDIVFNVGTKKEKFCGIVFDGISKENAKIFVNPHILYSGSDYRRVEILGAFCKE